MRRPVRVLVVDDSPTDVKLISRALGAPRSDLQIERAESLAEMRTKLAAGCDVVLCDWSMPGFGGFEALLVAKSDAPDVPFVIVSGTIGDEGAAAAMRGGAQDYVPKDNLSRLAGVVEREARNGRTRAELSARRAEYERFFELTLDLLAIATADGRYKRVNPAWRELGFGAEDLLGQSWRDIVHSDDEESTARAIERACLPGSSVVSFENRVRCRDGSYRYVHWMAQPCGDERDVYAAGRDITPRKSAEDEIRRAHAHLETRVAERTAELRRANEDLVKAKDAADRANRAKGTFLTHISHEIRTPMNAILGYSQLLGGDEQLSAKHQEHIETILRAGEHLVTLVDDVLTMAKIEAGQYKLVTGVIELSRFVDDLDRMLRLLASAEGLSFAIEISPLVPQRFVGDEGKLRQIAVNLIGNAIKFTKQGGVVARIGVGSRDGDRLLHIAVHDSGPGIVPQQLRDLFQPFAQADAGAAARGGTGLGLAISRDFARLMGGDITVESEVGRGSVFTLEIPLPAVDTPSPARDAGRSRVVGVIGTTRPGRVLVVDDDPASRRWAAALVAGIGFEVREATNGEEALEVFDDWKPRAVVTDLAMPRMDGVALVRAIRGRPTGVAPVIVAVTAAAFEEERQRALEAGADACLRKPCRDVDLLDELGRRLGLRYAYAERSLTPLAVRTPALPAELSDAIREAARIADYERLVELIDGLPPADADIAAALRSSAKRFAYDEILALTSRGEPRSQRSELP